MLLKLSAIALFVSFCCCAQVRVTVSPVPPKDAAVLFNGRFSKRLTPWLVGLENKGTNRVLVKESAVTNRIGDLSPLSALAVNLIVADAAKNSWLARAGRLIVYGGDLFILSRNVKTPPVNATWQKIIDAAMVAGPTVSQMIQGAQSPIQQNAAQLLWTNPVDLQPGDTGAVYVYTRPWSISDPKAQKREFVIDLANSQFAKVAQ